MKESHRTFSNLVLKGKLRQAVQFVYEREEGIVLQPDDLDEYHTGIINDTVALDLEGKHHCEIIPSYVTLETYKETTIFIPVKITEVGLESVAQKRLGRSGQGSTDSEALQGLLLRFGEDSTRLRTSVDFF